MTKIKDPEFIAAQHKRLSYLNSQLKSISKQISQIQEFLNDNQIRSNAQ